MYCSSCRKDPAYYVYSYAWPQITSRNINQKGLCKECYVASIEKRVKQRLLRLFKSNDYFAKNTKIGICFSGGKDSAVLLHIINKLKAEGMKKDFSMIVVNEGVEGGGDDLKLLAERNSKKYNMPLHFESFSNMFGQPLSMMLGVKNDLSDYGELRACDICTILKSYLFSIISQRHGVEVLIDGINIDDKLAGFMQSLMSPDFFQCKAKSSQRNAKQIQRVSVMDSCTDAELKSYADALKIEYITRECPYAEESMIKVIKKSISTLEENIPGFRYATFPNVRKIELMMMNLENVEQLDSFHEFSYCDCGRLKESKKESCANCCIVKFFLNFHH